MGIMTSLHDITAHDSNGVKIPAKNTYPHLYSSLHDTCSVHVCMWCMYVYLCPHVLVVHVVHVCVYGACMCFWCIYEKHMKSEKCMKSV